MTDLDALIAERELGMPRWNITGARVDEAELIAERRRILEDDYPTSGKREYTKPKKPESKPEPMPRRDYVIGEVEFLFGTDSPEHIARRLGYKNDAALLDSLRRWGRSDLTERMKKVA